ncbi:MAG: protein kinase [Anaerolineaceae bacterium]
MLSRGDLLNQRYRILGILGQGGMGAVYHAQDENLGVEVAVKENFFLTEEYTRQFYREATILAGLRHPNLPRVGDHFSIEGEGQYLVMDYIEGEDLRERMERVGTLNEEEAVQIGAAICDALTYLHTRKPPVVHRDIKPGNVKITPDGQVMLVDFGLAKVMTGTQATTTGARAMTPGYSPPEQYGTARTDPRTDIYSLGATLYAALTGVIPEDGLSRATGSADLTSPRKINSKVSRRMSAALERALELRPEDRFQTAEEFKQALLNVRSNTRQRAGNGEVVISPPPNADGQPNAQGEELPELPSAPGYRQPSAATSYPYARRRTQKGRAPILFGLILALIGLLVLYQADQRFANSLQTILHLQTSAPVVVDPQKTPTHTLQPTAAATATPKSRTATPVRITSTATPQNTPTEIVVVPPVNPVVGEIAFASNRTGVPQIWRMSANGTDVYQVTNLPGGACQPAWSPDGEKLVFISPCVDRQDSYPDAVLYTINRNGTGLESVPNSVAGDYDPAWSPDGKKIAFTSLRNKISQIYVVDLKTQVLEVLSNTRYPDRQPVWSPDGLQLAFVRLRTSDQIWLVSANGQSSSQFSRSGNLMDDTPLWSADGEMVYYLQYSDANPFRWLMVMMYADRNTSNEKRISPSDSLELGPIKDISLSPDGKWMVFEGWPDGKNHDIYRFLSADGSKLTRLTADPGLDFDPAWRPLSTTP